MEIDDREARTEAGWPGRWASAVGGVLVLASLAAVPLAIWHLAAGDVDDAPYWWPLPFPLR